jgi:hypothetical protein
MVSLRGAVLVSVGQAYLVCIGMIYLVERYHCRELLIGEGIDHALDGLI